MPWAPTAQSWTPYICQSAGSATPLSTLKSNSVVTAVAYNLPKRKGGTKLLEGTSQDDKTVMSCLSVVQTYHVSELASLCDMY
ncbi:hypothetical protein KIN20_011383 [Parelaphostrongylus tenuis]|uniref:Uncharacterized protein n=1 Tax=Parelaphostrongylus tenuis TaxID=148309 RepID=A0AAD5QPU6_PARTN|nr:hypothetical protein KIN20_011383 [Parelaphostrongylus tenuis]